MPQDLESTEQKLTELVDPRALLANWANANDEWVRLLVSEVIATGRPVSNLVIEKAYQLFRQEKALEERELPEVAKLDIEARQDESAPPLTITRLSEVYGVNALLPGAVIEAHEGLTILYGENGTGKTGYSRIFKALANSRTADTILGDIDANTLEDQTAKLEFKLGGNEQTLTWVGDRGISPFTRMSIFDSPAVTTHVDDDLDYVYTPVSLALFSHVTVSIQAVVGLVDTAIGLLGTGGAGLLSKFQRGSTIYPTIEILGASTDLADLKLKAAIGNDVNEQLDELIQTVGALQANTIGIQITALKVEQRTLMQAADATKSLLAFKSAVYNESLTKKARLTTDYETFRSELFAAADLPAAPDDTWSEFIKAGEVYSQHLSSLGVHDSDQCLYCRQPLLGPARELLTRYSTYLEDKISADIGTAGTALAEFKLEVSDIQSDQLKIFIKENEDGDNKPTYFAQIKAIEEERQMLAFATSEGKPANLNIASTVAEHRTHVDSALEEVNASIAVLEGQQQNRTKILEEKKAELLELKDAVELGRSWSLIEMQVNRAKELDRLKTLKRPLASLARSVTGLAKTASDQLINQNFDELFLEECAALRAPSLKVEFVGREGKAQRRKVMTGKHKPSKVLSEGEQKVLALADFLAEARLAGITAPVIFDDPVSSLDHRRIKEVAQRIARLADENQVIVFTHDILFATTLLSLFEKSKRCVYFQITDEQGKGKVTRGTGPRIDSMSAIKGRINSTIQSANGQDGEIRDALVRAAYSHIRAWCEVFTEEELLQGVTKRYRANVQMTTLPNIDGSKLDKIGPEVAEIFDIACGFIDGHSQPLITLGVSPTLVGLNEHWSKLQELKRMHDGVAG